MIPYIRSVVGEKLDFGVYPVSSFGVSAASILFEKHSKSRLC